MSLLEKVSNRWTELEVADGSPLFQKALDQVIERTRVNIERFGNRFPHTGEGTRYMLTDNSTWVSGYWTAWLWMAYYQTGDPVFRDAADRHFDGYNHRFTKTHIHCHDVGVIYDMAAVRGYGVSSDPKWKHVALRAAAVLSLRFHDKGQFLQAWGMPGVVNTNAGRTIIDSMCCIPLWFWASAESGDPYYRELATAQAWTVMNRLVRPDYSSGHTFLFEPQSEEPIGIRTVQGKTDDSTWSRGQGWGIQGFPVAYAYTGDERFLRTALGMVEWFVDHLGDNIVPPWDFSMQDEERDTSALALAVNGMLRLSHLQSVGESDRKACQVMACKAMAALIGRYSTLEQDEAWGLLNEAVYSKPDGRGTPCYAIWGDYYFVENLLILAGKNPLKLELSDRLGR